MEDILQTINSIMTPERYSALLKASTLMLVGLVLIRALTVGLARIFQNRASAQQLMLMRRGIIYGGIALTLFLVLMELGFNPAALLGTAGVLTVAIGFASQTAASNIISGLFLLFEGSFKLGDQLTIGEVTGNVISIDLLSIKIQTFDNQMVRIPNESLIKNPLTNLSRFPIRRIDVPVGVAYDSDMQTVKTALASVAEDNPLCLDEPVSQMHFLGFLDSAINLRFSVWVARENFVTVKAELPGAIKKAFDEAGVEIPFPQRVIRALPTHNTTDINTPHAPVLEVQKGSNP